MIKALHLLQAQIAINYYGNYKILNKFRIIQSTKKQINYYIYANDVVILVDWQ